MRSTVAALLLASGLPAVVDAAMLFKGCYNSAKGLVDQGKYTYQSSGYCQNKCLDENKPVFALWKGSNCLCGSELPPDSDKVSKSQCNVKCDGWPQDMCGGHGTYSIYLVSAADEASVPTMSSGSSTTTEDHHTQTKVITDTTDTTEATTLTTTSSSTGANGQPATETPTTTTEPTVVVTAPSQSEAAVSQGVSHNNSGNSTSSKSNTAAIAAGVVVGVVGFFALLGAIFFFWRFKKRKSQPNFVNTNPVEHYNKPMSTSSNSRFDGDFMAQRRQSNGSIDDDQDFSRRILQVTNPDR